MEKSVIIKSLIIVLITFSMLSCKNNQGDKIASGTFEAVEVLVSAEANGKIMELAVNEGDEVTKNEKLGFIDSTQLYLSKLQLLSSAKAVKVQKPDIAAQNAVLEEQIATLTKEKQRVENLIKAKVANQKQLDDINSQINVIEKQLSAQTSVLSKSNATINAQSSAMEIQVAQINDQLQKCYISSPLDGIVLEKYIEPGEFTTFGMPILKVANIKNMILRAYVTGEQMTKVKLNDTVDVYIDFGKNEMKKYQGKITWISSKAEFTPKNIQTDNERTNQVYAMKINVANDGFIKIGMYGEVRK